MQIKHEKIEIVKMKIDQFNGGNDFQMEQMPDTINKYHFHYFQRYVCNLAGYVHEYEKMTLLISIMKCFNHDQTHHEDIQLVHFHPLAMVASARKCSTQCLQLDNVATAESTNSKLTSYKLTSPATDTCGSITSGAVVSNGVHKG